MAARHERAACFCSPPQGAPGGACAAVRDSVLSGLLLPAVGQPAACRPSVQSWSSQPTTGAPSTPLAPSPIYCCCLQVRPAADAWLASAAHRLVDGTSSAALSQRLGWAQSLEPTAALTQLMELGRTYPADQVSARPAARACGPGAVGTLQLLTPCVGSVSVACPAPRRD